MRNAWDIFPRLCDVVQEAHRVAKTDKKGHGFGHDMEVAQISLIISPDEEIGKVVCAAAIPHSRDRMGTPELVGHDLKRWLRDYTDLVASAQEDAFRAILEHEGENRPEWISRLLQYADRIASMNLSVIGRSAQFNGIPVVSPEYAKGARNTKQPTCVLDTIDKVCEWATDHPKYGIVDNSTAREMAEARARELRTYQAVALAQFLGLGLHEMPTT